MDLANILLAVSNLPGLFYTLKMTGANRFIFTFMVMISFIAHLCENHRFGLKGVPINTRKTSILLLWFDRISAYLCTVRVLHYVYYVYYASYQPISTPALYFGLMALITLIWSSLYLHDPQPKYKYQFTIVHSIWHLMVYPTAYFIFH